MENKGKTYDPGWNDPPMFSYEARNAPPSKPRNILNKRIAFPLQTPPNSPRISTVDPTAPLPPCSVSLPPPPPSKPLSHSEGTVTSNALEDEESFDPDEALELIMKVLTSYVEQFENKEKDKEDILRRLNLMKDLWTDQKFSRDIQQKLLALSKALESCEQERADELQKGLMVDHPQLCSPWMSGIRQILRLQKESSEASAKDDTLTSKTTVIEAVPLMTSKS